jgi:hypothetical protein
MHFYFLDGGYYFFSSYLSNYIVYMILLSFVIFDTFHVVTSIYLFLDCLSFSFVLLKSLDTKKKDLMYPSFVLT